MARRRRGVDEARRRRRRDRRTPTSSSSATASRRRSTAGTTSRASTSRARRSSCSSTIRRCPIRRSDQARRADVQRQRDDLLRPLDLQVRGGGAQGRRRRPDRARDRPGRLSVRGRAGQPRREVRPRHARQEHGPGAHRRLDHARRGEAAVRDGGQDFDALQEAGVDARLQAGAARRSRRRSRVQQHAAHDRVAQRRREARGQRPGAEGRVRRLLGALGSPRRRRPTASKGDKIYNGALDNASGVAALLEIARAFTQVKPAPKRSILFLDGDRRGAGAARLAVLRGQPALSARRRRSPTSTSTASTSGAARTTSRSSGWAPRTSTTTCATPRQEQGRTLRPDPEPEKGFYYRSDHFNFAKQGVPALYTDTGVEFVGKPAGVRRAEARRVHRTTTTSRRTR